MIKDGLIEIESYAFNNIKNDKIVMPKTLNRFDIKSINNYSKVLEIEVSNKNTYLNNRALILYTEDRIRGKNIIRGLTIYKELEEDSTITVLDEDEYNRGKYDKEVNTVIIKEKLNKENTTKIIKAKTLGVKICINGVNKTVENIRMALVLTDEEHIKYTIENTIDDYANTNLYGRRILSNGFTGVRFEIKNMQSIKDGDIENTVLKLNRCVIVEGAKRINIYSNNKEYIINNIDRYYNFETK